MSHLFFFLASLLVLSFVGDVAGTLSLSGVPSTIAIGGLGRRTRRPVPLHSVDATRRRFPKAAPIAALSSEDFPDSPLITAASFGQTQEVARLIPFSLAETEVTNSSSILPTLVKNTLDEALVCAAMNGHYETCRLLLERGANPNTRRNEAITIASLNGYMEVVHLLLSSIPLNQTFVNPDLSSQLLLEAIDSMSPASKNEDDWEEYEDEAFQLVKFLIEDRKANPAANGNIALIHASMRGNLAAVQYLLHQEKVLRSLLKHPIQMADCLRAAAKYDNPDVHQELRRVFLALFNR